MTASLAALAQTLEGIADELRARSCVQRPPLPHGAIATALYEERCRRARMFERFGLPLGEPSWDMLLLLYLSQAQGRSLSVTALSSAGTSPTTGLRHLTLLQERGLVMREDDPNDQRRSWVRFTDVGLTAMRLHLEEIESAPMEAAISPFR